MSSRLERANAIRALSMDAVQLANSGHPGAPMGMADIAEVLWIDHMNHNPGNPQWWNRDRFVLSNGHGSMLIYALLHLTGYDLTIDDIKQFRQLHAKTPGHPEYGYTPGVETTTGPLGQGLANAVGFAIAEKNLASQFNRPGFDIVDHHTYVFVGDGCLMEGISHEVCSLAGTLGLGKLIVFYDDNGISIDGEVEGWFTDNTPQRFASYGWHVVEGVDGHDAAAINEAIVAAKSEHNKPTLICCKTVIGKGSPNKQGQESCHGAPLGDDEIVLTREALGWPHPAFVVPEAIASQWNALEAGATKEAAWKELMTAYESQHPDLAAEFKRRMDGVLPDNFAQHADKLCQQLQQDKPTIASRKASQLCIEHFAEVFPEFLGGSADLAGSNLTKWSKCQGLDTSDKGANYVYYGVREFGMSAIMNGVALHGGFVPFGGTFLIFMEYARNAVRMSALMKQRVVYVFTHDSIGLGEDGPTHQPVEQLTSLRTTPNMNVWRPADALETAVAWREALANTDGPTSLILSRQSLPYVERSDEQLAAVERGAYIVYESTEQTPELILIASGSELSLALEAAKVLADKVPVRVVSMPSSTAFDKQSTSYKESVLPGSVTQRIAIEAGFPDFWFKYVGLEGEIIGVNTFGESAPAKDLFEHFGLTTKNVVDKALSMLNKE